MKQKLMEFTAFALFLVPLFIILASPTFSSHALGLDDVPIKPALGVITQTFYGLGGQYDGWILETAAFSGIGGSVNSTTATMPIGDNPQNREYRGILTFNTSKIPDNAYVYAATLQLQGNGFIGTSPFEGGYLAADIKSGSFSGNPNLQTSDFRAPAHDNEAGEKYGCYAKAKCRIDIKSFSVEDYLNKPGLIQFRLRFSDRIIDGLKPDNFQIFTGDSGVLTNKPALVVRYYP